MPIVCTNGSKHQHATVDEVKACYMTPTTSPIGEHSRPARDRDVPQQRNGFGKPSDKQVKYATDLLGHAKLEPNGWKPESLSRTNISSLINQLKAYLNRTGPLPTFPVVHAGEPVSDTATQILERASREPYPDVPAGHYATISATGNNDLDFWRVDRPTEGRWAGRTFVKRVIGGKPNKPVRGTTALAALKAIEAMGIEISRTRYGTEIGQCWKCNRHLTDKISRELGIGPDCRSK